MVAVPGRRRCLAALILELLCLEVHLQMVIAVPARSRMVSVDSVDPTGAREGFAEHAERFGGLGTSSLVRKKSSQERLMIRCQKIEINDD